MKHSRILLIDDDIDDQFIFMDALGDITKDVECAIAKNGAEALILLQKARYRPTLIVLDLNMPVMNGFECLEKIRTNQEWIDIPVIVFTTSNNAADKIRSETLGAQKFLTKMSSYRELIRQIKNLLNSDITL